MNCGTALSSGPIHGRDIDLPELKPFSPAARLASSIRKSFWMRRVNNSGDMSWHKARVFVNNVFRNEEIRRGCHCATGGLYVSTVAWRSAADG
jgi:hypothetical protein